MTRRAVDVSISGRVQGVAFRWSALSKAEGLGVTGWVRNEPDGSVGAHFEGEADAVEALVDWCRQGPTGSRVGQVAVRDGADTGARRFEVRY